LNKFWRNKVLQFNKENIGFFWDKPKEVKPPKPPIYEQLDIQPWLIIGLFVFMSFAFGSYLLAKKIERNRKD